MLKVLERVEKLFDIVLLRFRVKKFLVVFVGSKFWNELEMLKKVVKLFEDKNIKVILVVVGKEVDFGEFIKVVFNKGNFIVGEKSYEDLKKLGDEVMVIVLKGEDFFNRISRINLKYF